MLKTGENTQRWTGSSSKAYMEQILKLQAVLPRNRLGRKYGVR